MSGFDRYFRVKKATAPVWADMGNTVGFLMSDGGVPSVFTVNACGGEKTRLSDNTEAILNIRSFPRDSVMLYTMDLGGNENEQLYWLDVNTKKSRALTASMNVRHYLGGLRHGTKKVVYSSNKRDENSFDICELDAVTGEERIVVQNGDALNIPASISHFGKYLLYNKLLGKNNNALWMCDLDTGKAQKIPSDELVSAETSPVWKHDDSGFYCISDRGTEFNHVAYYEMQSRTLKPCFLYDWDVANIALSCDDKYLAVVLNRDGYSELKIIECQSGSEIECAPLPKGVINDRETIFFSEEGHKLVFSFSSSVCVQGVRVLDIDANTLLTLTKGEGEELENSMETLVAPTLNRYKSFDGLEIPYFLYTPPSLKYGKNMPVVIDIHGGPEDQTRPIYNDYTQYFVSEGIAVVSPNVRGSLGYGKTYIHLDDVEKRLDSVRDIASLVQYLTESGIADKNRMAVFGISYGGFMSLSCTARYPELWACAVDFVGMYNLETFLKNTSPYRRAWREGEYGKLSENAAMLREVSPIAKVNDIRAPLMVVHGANDPRVSVLETEEVVKTLKERGLDVEYLRYEDEGHGVSKLKNRLDCYPKVMAFLKKHLQL